MWNIINPNSNFDFVGKRKICLAFSIAAIIGTFVLLKTKGLNYGIDFSGGAEVHVQVPSDWNIAKVRETLETGGVKQPHVIQIGEAQEHQFLVKVQSELVESELNAVTAKVESAFSSKLSQGQYQIHRADIVGPAAGANLRRNGFLSMLYALLCILIYVTVRFDVRYSPGAVIALLHDAIITVGVLCLTQTRFDLSVVAAILALIGYSNNDTIIVYDRVRETLLKHPHIRIEEIVNRATNETLARTLLTSLTTFVSVAALWAFGGPAIKDFAFTFMIGIVVGSYSSIFIASTIVIFMTNRQLQSRGSSKQKRTYIVRPEPKVTA